MLATVSSAAKALTTSRGKKATAGKKLWFWHVILTVKCHTSVNVAMLRCRIKQNIVTYRNCITSGISLWQERPVGSTCLTYLYRKTQASKLRGSASPHRLMLSNITTIKSTILFGFLIDPCSTVNGIIFFLDLSSGNNWDAFQNLLFYYSETDLNLLNKNTFYKCFFFWILFFSFRLAFLFSSSCPKVDVNLRLPE